VAVGVVTVTVSLLSSASRNKDRAEVRAIHCAGGVNTATDSLQSTKVSCVVDPCGSRLTFAQVDAGVPPEFGKTLILATVPVTVAIIAPRCKGASAPPATLRPV